MIEEYGVGDLVIAHPYRDNLNIEVVGYIVKIGKGIISRNKYVKIKGMKKNTWKDILATTIKIYEDDFDLVNFVRREDGKR